MKRLLILLCATLGVACHSGKDSPALSGQLWDSQVRSALCDLIQSQAGRGAYAVFDFDKTSIVHDVSQALWVYQVEHLCYADAPVHAFLDGIPDDSRMLGDETFAVFGATLKTEFTQLTALREQGMTFDQIHATEAYLDFRARMAYLLNNMDDVFGSEVSYLWMPGLLAGYTEEEARAVVREAVLDQLGKEKLAVQQWDSPDGRWKTPVERGIWFSPEMKELYASLSAHGITPYVCSASLELIVEVLACDAELGVGLPPEQVFGLRFTPADKVTAKYDPDYIQPIKAGKVNCINTYMSPRHEGKAPVLVGGDSNGDVAMLTAYPEMLRGLIIDVGRSAESAIGQLAAQARKAGNKGRYLLQPAFAKAAGSIEGGGI